MGTILNSNGLNLMKTRLQVRGGIAQQDRMIKDKRETLDKAVLYSYQGARVQRPGSHEVAPALINPNRLLQDYDEKILSIGFEYGYQVGDVFEWVNTGTKWLIYLQDLTELAYFKGDVRRCSYEISWEDEQGKVHSTYAAVIGPKDSRISAIKLGHGIIDTPNYSITLLLPKNNDTLNYFQRNARFLLKLSESEKPICWSVQSIDSISTPGIVQIFATEDYINTDIDKVEDGIINTWDPLPIEQPSLIIGEKFIRPKKTYSYTYSGTENGSWSYEQKLPIEAIIDGKTISIKWNSSYSGQFVLKYGSSETTIVIESLF